jgi:hypothetical protein
MAFAVALQIYRSRALAAYLPQGTHLNYISWYPLRKVHRLVFEQLSSRQLHYLRESELRQWFEMPELTDVEISWQERSYWRASARVGARAAAPAAAHRVPA